MYQTQVKNTVMVSKSEVGSRELSLTSGNWALETFYFILIIVHHWGMGSKQVIANIIGLHYKHLKYL